MAHTGLRRVVKTVRGKKGSTKRAYWVKSKPTTRMDAAAILAKHGTRFGAMHFGSGVATGFGAGVGSHFGGNGVLVGAGLGGLAGGAAMLRHVRRSAMSGGWVDHMERDMRHATLGAHVAMVGLGATSYLAGAAAGATVGHNVVIRWHR